MEPLVEQREGDEPKFWLGFLVSLFFHLIGAVLFIFILENPSARAMRQQQIFTVSLEGGEKLGGINQAPKRGKEGTKPKRTAPLVKTKQKQDESQATETKKATKKLTGPAVVDDPEKIKKEKEKKAQAKKAAEKKKKKKAAVAKKKRDAEAKAKAAAAEKKKEEQARKAREKKFEEAITRARDRYEGESYDAGGEGFGAAALGGKGMGGGTLASLEFIAYRNQLEEHVKTGWRWLHGQERLLAQVVVRILPTGVIQDVRILKSSGNQRFDDSVLRAVYKASPVPPAPESLYDKFREVIVTFDSQQ